MYAYTDRDGDLLLIDRDVAKPGPDGTRAPVVAITIANGAKRASVHIDPGRIEELIAGIRDTARPVEAAS